MSDQQALTIIAPVVAGRESALKVFLNEIGDDVLHSRALHDHPFPFRKLTTVHFMRWVVLDPEKDPAQENASTPSQLAMETNYDGPLEAHLDELVSQGGTVLCQIYEHCSGFAPAASPKPGALKDYLLAHRVTTPTFYIGTRGLSVSQILKDKQLRTGIEAHLDTFRGTSSWFERSPEQMRNEIIEFVKGRSDLAWSLNPEPSSAFQVFLSYLFGILNFGARALLPLLAIVLGVHFLGASWGVAILALLGCIAALIGVLLVHELTDPETNVITDSQNTNQIAQREDHQLQNQMTDVVFVKPGLFRQAVLRSVLWAINWLARFLFNKGELGGIPSIHFARWVIIDGGRRLLFFSNFDGSWESYLDDFIDKAAGGLTAVWSNAYLFPRSYGLLFGGARDEQRFKPYVRRSQLPTEIWYSAYPDLSVQNINDNARIRRMLSGQPRPKEVQECLRLL